MYPSVNNLLSTLYPNSSEMLKGSFNETNPMAGHGNILSISSVPPPPDIATILTNYQLMREQQYKMFMASSTLSPPESPTSHRPPSIPSMFHFGNHSTVANMPAILSSFYATSLNNVLQGNNNNESKTFLPLTDPLMYVRLNNQYQHHQQQQQQQQQNPTPATWNSMLCSTLPNFSLLNHSPQSLKNGTNGQDSLPLKQFDETKVISETETKSSKEDEQEENNDTFNNSSDIELEDEDDSKDCKANKRRRTCFSSEQLLILEREFHLKKYLSLSERSRLSSALKLSEAQIKIWFQNRRAKWKRVKGQRASIINGNATSHNNGNGNHLNGTTTNGGHKIHVPIPVHVDRVRLRSQQQQLEKRMLSQGAKPSELVNLEQLTAVMLQQQQQQQQQSPAALISPGKGDGVNGNLFPTLASSTITPKTLSATSTFFIETDASKPSISLCSANSAFSAVSSRH